MAINHTVEVTPATATKVPKNKLHLNGGVLAKSRKSDLVVLFISETRGTVIVPPNGAFYLFEKYDILIPYYNSKHWEILPKDTIIDIRLQQK